MSVSPSSGARGTTFSEPGYGFTPYSTASLHLIAANGTTYPPTPISTDSTGQFAHSYASSPSNLTGTYQYYGVDDSTGERSGTVTFSRY